MDLKYYYQLFADLNKLSNQLSYSTDLERFNEYVEFYFYLDREQDDILYRDSRYYFLDNLKEDLKEIAEHYISHCHYGTVSSQKDIPYISEPITEMLRNIGSENQRENNTAVKPNFLTEAALAEVLRNELRIVSTQNEVTDMRLSQAIEKGLNNVLKSDQSHKKLTHKELKDSKVNAKIAERSLKNLRKLPRI